MSSAIACNLAMGYDIVNSIQNAKDYITKALRKIRFRKGSGPLNHTLIYKNYVYNRTGI